MQLSKVPVGAKKISKMMNLNESEVQFWDSFEEVKNLITDYNFDVISKNTLIEKLLQISLKNANKNLYFYCTGIDRMIEKIKLCY